MGLEENLPRTFSASNRAKTKALKRKIQEDVQMVEPFFLATMTVYNFLLPPLTEMPRRFAKLLTDAIIDGYMKKELEECKAVNWCRNIRTLSPIKNKGDGNCLLHAVSLFMWGVHDSMLLLRRLLYIALVHDTGQIKARWRKERGFLDQNIPDGCQLNSGQWESEWQHVVKSAEDQKQMNNNQNRLPYESLEEVHIFMLSNIIRRPIIVLGDSVIRSIKGKTLATNNFVGIYLPLLRKPRDCIKSPVVLGFASNHFVPLVAMEEDLASEHVPMTTAETVALVTNTLTFIGVHFLMPDEEERVNELLQEYLQITEVPVTEKSGLTLVLSAKLNITKLPKDDNLMIDFVQAAERVFDGKEAIDPGNNQRHTGDIDLTGEIVRNDSKSQLSAHIVDSYHASRERQQRMLEKRPSLKKSTEKVNYNTEDKNAKRHFVQEKVAMSTRKPEHSKSVKCKTPNCRYYGSVETHGYCSSCLAGYLKRTAASRAAAGGSRMDSYEMSVTSTDCQYPDCPYVASVFTYPYCHEHKALSPHHAPEVSASNPRRPSVGDPSPTSAAEQRASVGGKRQVNDLNKEKSHAKSSSLNETTSSSSSRGKGMMQREHSRSLEDVNLPGDVDPGYVYEARPDWCKVPGCYLMGHPVNDNLCIPHFSESRLAKDTIGNENIASSSEKVENWLRKGESFSSRRSDGSVGSGDITKPVFKGRKCKNENCDRQGNPLFKGCCTDCYLKLDINGDTDPLERPPYKVENSRAQTDNEEDKNIMEIENNLTDTKINHDKDDINIVDHNLESFEAPESFVDEKHEAGRADTQEFHKCMRDTCNRLAPPSGTEGLCSDCHYRKQDSPTAETPFSLMMRSDVDHRVDTASHAAVKNPPKHYVRNVSLQSYPSVPVKLAYPSKTVKPTPPLPVKPPQEEELEQLRCSTPGCSGIFVKLDHNRSGLCYKCLKERKEAAHPAPTNVEDESPTSSDELHLLRRHSGGRRSGRKRHTIAIPPTLPYGANGETAMEEKSCVSPLCAKTGSPTYKGFCRDCYMWMSFKFEQGSDEDRKTPCSTKGCEFYGTPATNGYCSQCFRKHQKLQGNSVSFGPGRQNSSGRSVTPPPGARGKLCANQHCNKYGQKAYSNFCPSCFKTFDACTGISYNPAPTRGSFERPGTSNSDAYYRSSAAAAHKSVFPPFVPTSVQFVPPIDISPTDTSNISGISRPSSVTKQFGETMERVESAIRFGKEKCVAPNCTSFGNSKCRGYCNSCYVKMLRANFV